ncbi:MAG: Uma2 family endonuclease [Nitrospinae bacterium]|nr:Uma2 family endonuclease [Nitrospinota bacterium]
MALTPLDVTPATDVAPDIADLITEDDTPVDNLRSEKQQRLLTEPLYSAWAGPGEGRLFLAAANVGVFAQARNPAIVPDMFLSLDVQVADNWWEKGHRSYMVWEFGKPPDLVVEIVSNTVGEEDGKKKRAYAWMRVNYYVIYDPLQQVMPDVVTIYRLRDFAYERQESAQFPALGLGLTLWEGVFEARQDTWLRWTDAHGGLIPTGKELAEQERQRADQERQRAEQAHQRAEQAAQREAQAHQQAEQERQRADQAHQRAERLAALLRQAGIDPEPY